MNADDPIPISALEHYRYCPRQCALILVDGIWNDNAHTVRGSQGHRRADTAAARRERHRLVARAVPLWSQQHGLTGRADAVEIDNNGQVRPVEYKIGRRHGDTAEVQLCAQALCLEEMLAVPVDAGAIWYSGPRRRHHVAFTEALRSLTIETIAHVRALRAAPRLPGAVNDARCTECQLAWNCLPSLVATTSTIERYLQREVFQCDT